MSNFPILSLITYFPLAGALVIFFWANASPKTTRQIALWASIGSFVASLIMLAGFDSNKSGMQWTEHMSWLPSVGIHYDMGIDGISVLLVVLTTLLSMLAIIWSFGPIQTRVREYFIAILLLEMGMIGVFVSLDLFLFYIFFELSLIPMALLIGVWGSANRVYAAIKFFLYTLAGSLLMLVGIVATYQAYYEETGVRTLNILELSQGHYGHTFQMWTFAAFFIAFAIKVPMWPFHTWLPDAHTEAPTAGSVLLAGVLLKIGGYGLIRFNLPLFEDAARTWAPWIMVLSVIAIIYGALVALPQPDMKKLIAYSSVSHMGFVTLGIFSFTMTGMYGAMIVMLSHGFVTSGLFMCVGVLYDRAHTRMISAFGGLATRMPIYASLFGVLMFASIGLPGLSGFVGEYLAMQGAFREYYWAGAISMFVVILAAWYMMWLYQRVVFMRQPEDMPDPHDNELTPEEVLMLQRAGVGHGDAHGLPAVSGGSGDTAHAAEHGRISWPDLDTREIVAIVPLVILSIVLGVWPGVFMNVMQRSLEAALQAFGSIGI